MKEQINQFQKDLEKIPQLKPEVHFIINDVAQKILNGQELDKIERDAIEAIFIELQDLDRNIVTYLLDIKSKGIISNEECNMVVSYFLASKQIGPDSAQIRDLIFGTPINSEDFGKIAKDISIPEYSRLMIMNIYKKILENKNQKKTEDLL